MIAFCNPVQGRKHRVHPWHSTEADPLFGIQANVERGLWAHVVDGDKPVIYADKRLAQIRARELSRAA